MHDWEQLCAALQSLGLGGDLWLCRGAVRCELLGELKEWDDFDVMTSMPTSALDAISEKFGTGTSRTFYGGYSFSLPSGRKVDLWSIAWTRGRRCASLAEALSTFEFNVDAIAQSVRSGAILDPLGVQAEIIGRQLRVLQPTECVDNRYMPWKAAYLVLRHDFTPDCSVVRLWNQNPSTDGLPETAVRRLQRELRELDIHKRLDKVQIVSKEYPGLSRYIEALTFT